jgi:hypothetical protein
MQRPILDYKSSEAAHRSTRIFSAVLGIGIVTLVVFVTNIVFIESVVTDKPGGWADLGVVLGGQFANGLIIIFAAVCSPIIWRFSGGRSALLYLIISVAFPLLSYWVDYVLIMGHHLR